MKEKIQKLSREDLQKVILSVKEFLTEEQVQKMEELINDCIAQSETGVIESVPQRMSQEMVTERMGQIEVWQEQMNNGELYLCAEEYEDDSTGYWDPDWITEHYDNQGIGDKIVFMV